MAEMVNRPNPPPPQPPRRRGARGGKIPAKNKEKWYQIEPESPYLYDITLAKFFFLKKRVFQLSVHKRGEDRHSKN